MKSNNTSVNFPFRTMYGGVNSAKNNLSLSNSTSSLPKVRISCTNEYTNETPDFFRIDSMIQSQKRYNNPFLDEVISQDRSRYLKMLQRSRTQIALIDHLKSSRLLSQDKELISRIKNENTKGCFSPISSSVSSSPLKQLSPEHTNYSRTIRNLDLIYSPKIPFQLKQKIDKKSLISLGDPTNGLKCSKLDKENVEMIKMAFDPRKSGYLRNMSTYDIRENEKVNGNSMVHLERNEESIYNPIIDKVRTVKPDMIVNDKWNHRNETYMILLDENNLKRKGGLFSEYCNRNRIHHDLHKISKGKKNMIMFMKHRSKSKDHF